MSDARRQLVEDIFAEAAACEDDASREAVLNARCGGDAALHVEVASLLGFAAGEDSLLDHPAIEMGGSAGSGGSDTDDGVSSLVPGSMFGHYRILRVLGSGGMGVVYLAESDRPRRQVALKVIRAGGASRSILRRFEREAQVLAMLRHPGIAHIYETGAADAGQPRCRGREADGRSIGRRQGPQQHPDPFADRCRRDRRADRGRAQGLRQSGVAVSRGRGHGRCLVGPGEQSDDGPPRPALPARWASRANGKRPKR